MDSPATGHYFRFALCDDQGQVIRDKGVRLKQVEPLPLQDKAREKEEERQGEGQKEATAIRMTRAEEPRQIPLTMARENRQAIASMDRNEVQRLRDEWRNEVERQVAELRAEVEVQLQEARQESNVGWFVRRVEGLERDNLKLRLERDQAIAEAIQNLDKSGEVARLKSENEALAQALRLAQEKLNAFRRLLNGDTADLSQRSEDKTKEPEAVRISPPDFAEKEEEVEGAIAKLRTHSPHPESTDDNSRPKETEATQATARASTRGPKAGKAFRRAESIFLAIKDWNRLYPAESFSINPGLIETIFKVHRQAVKEFFEVYQNELWDYHQEIGVDSPRWHNRGKDTQKLRAFVQERLMEQ
jgi:hypothetical protein